MEMQQGMSTEETSASTQVPPPTSIETLQYFVTTQCAIPQEELTNEKLIAPLKGKEKDEAWAFYFAVCFYCIVEFY